jgi:hypothetical protein
LNTKLKGHHFDTNEAESHVVLNTLTEQNLQNASAGNGEYAWKGTTSRVLVASRPKDSFFFEQMAAPVP